MPRHIDRFLKHAIVLEEGPTLGRVFAVTRETWALSDDPRSVPPRTALLVTRRTASEAADIAREAAESFKEHGFHKPSGAWWGSDGVHFHRYIVSPGRPRANALLIGAGVAGLAGLALVGWLRAGRRAAADVDRAADP